MRNWGEVASKLVNNKSHTTVSKVQWISGHINLANARVLINKATLKKIKKTKKQGRQWTLGPQLDNYGKVAEKVKQKQLIIPLVKPEDVELYGLWIDSNRALKHTFNRPLRRVIRTMENTSEALINFPFLERQISLCGQFTPVNRPLFSTVETSNKRDPTGLNTPRSLLNNPTHLVLCSVSRDSRTINPDDAPLSSFPLSNLLLSSFFLSTRHIPSPLITSSLNPKNGAIPTHSTGHKRMKLKTKLKRQQKRKETKVSQ